MITREEYAEIRKRPTYYSAMHSGSLAGVM